MEDERNGIPITSDIILSLYRSSCANILVNAVKSKRDYIKHLYQYTDYNTCLQLKNTGVNTKTYTVFITVLEGNPCMFAEKYKQKCTLMNWDDWCNYNGTLFTFPGAARGG